MWNSLWDQKKRLTYQHPQWVTLVTAVATELATAFPVWLWSYCWRWFPHNFLTQWYIQPSLPEQAVVQSNISVTAISGLTPAYHTGESTSYTLTTLQRFGNHVLSYSESYECIKQWIVMSPVGFWVNSKHNGPPALLLLTIGQANFALILPVVEIGVFPGLAFVL